MFENTFLAEISRIGEEGNFAEISLAVQQNEVEIGEMTVLEKACYTFSERQDDLIRQMLGKCAKGLLERPEETKISSIKKNICLSETAVKIMWRLIEERLETWQSLGIRKGFKIVTIEE